VKRLAGALVLVMALSTGCRGGESAPGPDQQVDNIESTLDAIESEVAGD
jgi:hypothetical protein